MATKKTPSNIKPSSKISNFVETRRQSAIINIENSTFFGVLIKWALTNWIALTVVITLGLYSLSLYMNQKELEAQALAGQIQILQQALDQNKKDNELLLSRINTLNGKKKLDALANSVLRKSLSKLTSKELKDKMLEDVKRIKAKRGIKD